MSADGDAAALAIDELRSRLAANPLVTRVVVLDWVGSTNDELRRLAAEGAPSGTVLLAAAQSGGRGRRGRAWFSPPGGGLFLSLLLRPESGPRHATRWTLAAALAACEACRALSGRPVRIKWPNDLLLDGRKLAGVLAEMRSSAGRECELVLGIGINVSLRDEELPPGLRRRAIALHPGAPPGMLLRERLAAECLERLAGLARQLAAGDWDSVSAAWLALAPGACGQLVRVLSAPADEAGRVLFEGRTAGLDGEGALLVKRADGTLETVRTADTVVPVE